MLPVGLRMIGSASMRPALIHYLILSMVVAEYGIYFNIEME